jgi:hypothetical protein
MLSSNPLLRGTDASGFDQQMLGKTPNGWYFCDNLTSFIKDDIAIWKGPPGHVAVIVEADESSTGTAASANYHNDRAASFDTVSVDSVKGVWRRVPDSQREEKVKGCWETNHSRVL